ncbi:N-ethylmaleimide reductase [Hyella patelloides LEGE 07179]|uniref:N-ethylmaleimide reductase n=1 Tax=Hyella patelloides LEGE 07179 TaxID=945734 RepID=A0A563VTN0_9CYAN|nr:alkene reductase [Hyella patelloides]VEP14765.1 N-ethylmaleimide reductase [Hyella patelloides LEGE 07179]
MTSNLNLFSSFKLGEYTLPNRMVMAPMTRLRANGTIPTELMGTYYAQRASAGLIITECTMVSSLSNGYINCPGIYDSEQVAGWKLVTQAVHAPQSGSLRDRGGKIFLQLWHSGRVAHPALLDGELPVAPSAIAGKGQLHTPIGKVDLETPRALETEEIAEIVEQFRQGAKNAMNAGFDGVELHGAFGYLIDQFLQDGSNQRTDEYGGTIANCARFLLEVVRAVTEVWRGDRVGIKLSPSNTFYGMLDSNPQATFSYVIKALNDFNLAYIHLMEPNEVDLKNGDVINHVLPTFKPFYHGTIITNGGYDKKRGNQVIAAQDAELVSYGKLFLANPDLPQRFLKDADLNEPNPKTFYGRGDDRLKIGYTDYPFLNN